MSGSIGIVTAIGVSAVLGLFVVLGLLFSIQDYEATLNSKTGQPVAQIFLDCVGTGGAIVLMVIAHFLLRHAFITYLRSKGDHRGFNVPLRVGRVNVFALRDC